MTNGSRPEYGEYASPEDQAKAIARSQPEALPASPAAVPPPESATAPVSAPPVPAARPAAARLLDRLLTVVLLALGLVYLIGGAGGYLDLATTLDTVYAQFGIGEYTPAPATSAFGIAFIASQAVIWVVVAAWSYWRLSRGRRTWWVPVLGAVATFVVTVALFAALLASDPAFLAYVSTA